MAAAAALTLVGHHLGSLWRALGRIQPLGDRRGASPAPGGALRNGRGGQRSAGVRRAAVAERLGGDEPGRGAQHGSLDVLLATPLSTRSIVLGKWWAAFRGVPPLTVLPVLIAAALATHTGFALAPVLIGGLILAYGAAITSLGLALATWLPRMDRAIGLTAGLYVVVLIGAIPAGTILLGKGPGGARDGFAAASPFWGVGFSSAVFGGTSGRSHEIEKQAGWLAFWIVAYGLVAFGLLLATLKTFNRCLGRIDERLTRRGPLPHGAGRPATWLPDAELASTSTSDPARPRRWPIRWHRTIEDQGSPDRPLTAVRFGIQASSRTHVGMASFCTIPGTFAG